jgi:hypothetical protein
MQDQALTAFATRHGSGNGRRDVLRTFTLYAKIGPAMWQAIERDHTARAGQIFADFKPRR